MAPPAEPVSYRPGWVNNEKKPFSAAEHLRATKRCAQMNFLFQTKHDDSNSITCPTSNIARRLLFHLMLICVHWHIMRACGYPLEVAALACQHAIHGSITFLRVSSAFSPSITSRLRILA